MRLLLDTNVLLRCVYEPTKLAPGDLGDILNEANDVLFSAASIWEVAIKANQRRADFQIDPTTLYSTALIDFREIEISSAATIRAATLQLIIATRSTDCWSPSRSRKTLSSLRLIACSIGMATVSAL